MFLLVSVYCDAAQAGVSLMLFSVSRFGVERVFHQLNPNIWLDYVLFPSPTICEFSGCVFFITCNALYVLNVTMCRAL